MTDNTSNTEELKTDELTVLKGRAKKLGINYHPNIGLDTLRTKINSALDVKSDAPKQDNKDVEVLEPEVNVDNLNAENMERELAKIDEVNPNESRMQRKARLRKHANKLVRVRVTCMNPAKKEWTGEIFTFSNSAVGTIKKFVKFDAEDGWHVPECIYKMIRDRKYQTFYSERSASGRQVRRGKLVSEFAIEVMQELSPEEIASLAKQQAMAKA